MKPETAFYGALRNSGMPHRNATAIVNALEKEMTTVLASKADLKEVRAELKSEIATVRSELKEVRFELKSDLAQVRFDLAEVRSGLKADITKVSSDMKTIKQELQTDMAKLNNTLTIRMGMMLATCGGSLFAALKYLN